MSKTLCWVMMMIINAIGKKIGFNYIVTYAILPEKRAFLANCWIFLSTRRKKNED